jgi:hypothetical protein
MANKKKGARSRAGMLYTKKRQPAAMQAAAFRKRER